MCKTSFSHSADIAATKSTARASWASDKPKMMHFPIRSLSWKYHLPLVSSLGMFCKYCLSPGPGLNLVSFLTENEVDDDDNARQLGECLSAPTGTAKGVHGRRLDGPATHSLEAGCLGAVFRS